MLKEEGVDVVVEEEEDEGVLEQIDGVIESVESGDIGWDIGFDGRCFEPSKSASIGQGVLGQTLPS